jgi:hypothetical protein
MREWAKAQAVQGQQQREGELNSKLEEETIVQRGQE